jgi:hypothetical protein
MDNGKINDFVEIFTVNRNIEEFPEIKFILDGH